MLSACWTTSIADARGIAAKARRGEAAYEFEKIRVFVFVCVSLFIVLTKIAVKAV